MKYFVYAGNGRIGLKYNRKYGIMSIGSYTRFETTIFNILFNFCGLDNIDRYRIQSQSNKVRYDVKMKFRKYCELLDKLRESYVLEETKTLHRIMR